MNARSWKREAEGWEWDAGHGMSLDLEHYEKAGALLMKLRKRRGELRLSKAAVSLLLDELSYMLVPGEDSAVAALDILQILDKRAQ